MHKSLWVTIQYEYMVGNRTYKNHVIYFGPPNPVSRREGAVILGEFPAKHFIPVYYQPENPQVSCLKPGKLSRDSEMLVLVAVLFVSFGFLHIVVHSMSALGRYLAHKP